MRRKFINSIIIVILVFSIIVSFYFRFSEPVKTKNDNNEIDNKERISLITFINDLIMINYSNLNINYYKQSQNVIILVVKSPICENCVINLLEELQKIDVDLCLMVDKYLYNNFDKRLAFLNIEVKLILNEKNNFNSSINLILILDNKHLILPLPESKELESAKVITSIFEKRFKNYESNQFQK